MPQTDLERLVYQMSAETRQLIAANKAALVDVKKTTTSAQREYDKLAADMGRGFGKASLMAGVAFGAIVGYATKAASDASETANAFSVAFGSLEKQAQAFAKSYSKDVGRALDETQANMAKTQLVLTGVGIAAGQALGMTEAIQKRSIDIGSLWNVSDAEAYQAILSGISGEAEPLKKFGVALNEAAVKAELLRLGFKGNAEQAPEAAKSIARLNLIMKASASADGDAIKTKDGLANSTKRAQAEFRDAAVELGQNFLPMATQAAHAAADLLKEFNAMPDGVKLAGLAMLGLVASAGPIASLCTGLAKVIKFAGAARVALLAVPGAGAAGAVGSAAAGVALPAAAAAATLSLGGDTQKWSRQDILNQRLADEVNARKKIAEYEGKSGAAAERKLKFWQEVLAGNQREIQDMRAREQAEVRSANRAAQRKKAASGEVGLPSATSNFGLTPDLKKPVAGGAKKTGKTEAEKAADLAVRQADRFNAEMARAQDDELRARDGLKRGIEAQAQIALDRIKVDEDARTTDLKLAVQKKELTQAQADQLTLAEGKARAAQKEAINAQKEEDLREERLRLDQELAGFDADVLSAQASMATSMLERAQIERRLLQLRQQQESKSLEQDLAKDPNLTDEQKRALREGQKRSQDAAYQDLVANQARDLKASILEAFTAARGGAQSLAKYFGDKIQMKLMDRLGDLLSQLLMNAGAATGGKGVLGAVAKFAGFFAGGGTIPGGQWGVVNDGGVEAVRAKPGGGIEVMSNKALRGLGAPAAGRGGTVFVSEHHHNDFRGAVMTQDLLERFEHRAQQAENNGAMKGAALARRGAQGAQMELDSLGR